MEAIEAVKEAAKKSGVTYAAIADAMGKRPNYISSTARQGGSQQANTLAAMLEPCGYKLAAIPSDSVPDDALVIDPKDNE